MTRSFRLTIFSNLSPRGTARLVAKIHREIPEARVCGILFERQAPRSRLKQGEAFGPLAKVINALLRLIHACPARPNGPAEFGLRELARFCETMECSLCVTGEMNSLEGLNFVRNLLPDLGIAYGTIHPNPELCRLPSLGLIQANKQMVSQGSEERSAVSREALHAKQELRIGVYRLDSEDGAGSILHSTSIPVDPYDTLTSLGLKSDLIENDLLIRAVGDLARRIVSTEGAERSWGSSEPQPPAGVPIESVPRRSVYRPVRGRPIWKLLARTLLFGPYFVVRNWIRRLRGAFPIVILYHHLVTDRPHSMGIPTDSFFRHVKFLKEHYKVIALTEAVGMLKTGRVTAPTVVLTLDDGYRENFVGLRAVAEAMDIPVTLFVCTENVTLQKEFAHDLTRGERNFWPLTWDQIGYMQHNGFEIGSHTRSHFDCGSRDLQALRDEIVGSKTDLENRLRSPVRFFSFPWGHLENMSPEAVQLAKANYPHVCSAFGGVNFASRGDEPWHLRRVSHPNDIWELELALQSILSLSFEG